MLDAVKLEAMGQDPGPTLENPYAAPDAPDAADYDYPYDDDGPSGFEHPCPVCNGTGQPVGEFSACYKCYGEGYLDD